MGDLLCCGLVLPLCANDRIDLRRWNIARRDQSPVFGSVCVGNILKFPLWGVINNLSTDGAHFLHFKWHLVQHNRMPTPCAVQLDSLGGGGLVGDWIDALHHSGSDRIKSGPKLVHDRINIAIMSSASLAIVQLASDNWLAVVVKDCALHSIELSSVLIELIRSPSEPALPTL